ncbi:LOW QUALITY PROTEIN: V-set domain-containing T-cell activation inhibitor 1 [Acridotheres tristis]
MGCEGGGLCANVVLSFFPNSMTTDIVILAAVITLIIGFCACCLTFLLPPCPLLAGKHSISVTALMSPGNIGQLSILGCTFKPDIQMDSIVIQWAKEGVAGLVHIKGGKDHLQEQDLSFQGHTAMFVDQVMGRNASLELRNVQLSDAGTYQCSVTTARGSGKAVLQYRTGAFSIPVVQVNNSHGNTLQCEGLHLFPCPAVHCTAYSDTGEHLPHAANTSYELNPKNVTMRVVSLLHNITANAIYTSVIENSIAKAMGNIRATDFSVTKLTNLQLVNLNAESVSSSFLACHWMLLLPLYLLSTQSL